MLNNQGVFVRHMIKSISVCLKIVKLSYGCCRHVVLTQFEYDSNCDLLFAIAVYCK